MSQCPFDLCDGSGLIYDEASNTTFDCRCRRQIIALRKARSLSAVIPRRYRDVAFERYPVTEIEPVKGLVQLRKKTVDGIVPVQVQTNAAE